MAVYRNRERLFYLFLALLLYAADAIFKRAALAYGRSLSFNAGVSFGLFRDGGETAVVMNAAVFAILFFAFAHTLRVSKIGWARAPLAMLSAGAAGNFTDRLIYGHVVDWLPMPSPFFGTLWMNAADVWLIIGAAILAFRLLFPSR